MTPIEPIPETVEALDELDPSADGAELVARLTRLARRAEEMVPDLVGVSIARVTEGITFTLVATAEQIAVLDAVQYAAGGPCVEAGHANRVREFDNEDILDEQRWQSFAQATAARTVRSTLTLPIVADGRVVGTINLYAASGHAFGGLHDALADIFGAWAAGAMANADLSFATRREAQAAPERIRDRVVVDVAIGVLAVGFNIDVDAAGARLRAAAARAGVSAAQLARVIVSAHQGHGRDEA